jgi:hypothetical protein
MLAGPARHVGERMVVGLHDRVADGALLDTLQSFVDVLLPHSNCFG